MIPNEGPKLPFLKKGETTVIIQDPRTPEQIEADRQQAAEALNGQLFADPGSEPQLVQPQAPECPWARPSTRNTPYLAELLTAMAW